MTKKAFWCMVVPIVFASTTIYAESSFFNLDETEGFKRYSISVGPLHVMPQGKAKAPKIRTAVKNGEVAKNGDITLSTVFENLDPDKEKENQSMQALLKIVDAFSDTYPASQSGTSTVSGIESWSMDGSGMTADDVTTLGIMINYHFNDKISFESKAGFPPKVDIQGKGKITAPFTAEANSTLLGIPLPTIYLKNDLPITDLESHGNSIATARAWTPMWELQYHFGQTGINKFRPYVGLGLMVAYFNELELNPSLEKDLIDSGHMIANMKNGRGGDTLIKGKKSTANPKVKLESELSFAPIATLGFTYDFNQNWFAVASISYAHLTGKTTIEVNDDKLGTLFSSEVDLEVNPIIGYAGVGYRF